MRELKPGDFFGHEEMLQEKENLKMGINQQILRATRVRAIMQSDLIYLNKADFFKCKRPCFLFRI